MQSKKEEKYCVKDYFIAEKKFSITYQIFLQCK